MTLRSFLALCLSLIAEFCHAFVSMTMLSVIVLNILGAYA